MSEKTNFILGMILMSFLILLFMFSMNFFVSWFFLGLFKEQLPTNIDLQEILKYIVISILFIIDILIIKKVIKDFKGMYKYKMIEIKENKTKYNSYGPSYNTSSDNGFDGFSSFGDCTSSGGGSCGGGE